MARHREPEDMGCLSTPHRPQWFGSVTGMLAPCLGAVSVHQMAWVAVSLCCPWGLGHGAFDTGPHYKKCGCSAFLRRVGCDDTPRHTEP